MYECIYNASRSNTITITNIKFKHRLFKFSLKILTLDKEILTFWVVSWLQTLVFHINVCNISFKSTHIIIMDLDKMNGMFDSKKYYTFKNVV